MALELDGNFVIMIWVRGDGATHDWLAHLIRRGGEQGPLYAEYRFRYYDPANPGADPFESNDEKSWYALEVTDPRTPEAKVIAALDDTWKVLGAAGFGDEAERVEIRSSDPDVIFAKLKKMKFMHVREEKR